MSTGMIDIIKLASMSAVENGKPCDLRFGTVISVNPLKVQITTDLIIPESLIVVPKNLTNHSLNTNMGNLPNYLQRFDVTVSEERLTFILEEYSSVNVSNEQLIFSTNESANNGNGSNENTLTVYNTLKVGDKVVLIRNQGGKVYYILDRI